MRILSLFFVLIYYSINAQTQRFIYEYQYISDTVKLEVITTKMVLDINPTDVKFYPFEQLRIDSLNKVNGYKNFYWDDEVPTLIRPRNSNINTEFFSFDGYFKLETEDHLDWKLTNDTKVLDNYLLQKANTNFGGRVWEAWFAKDIVVNEGPFKFNGLPGLIFEIKDTQGYFTFKLIESKQLNKTYDSSPFIEKFSGQNPVAITKKQFDKIVLDMYNNPLNGFKESFRNRSPGDVFKVMNIEVKSMEQFKELTEMTQKRLRDTNNKLEKNKMLNLPIR